MGVWYPSPFYGKVICFCIQFATQIHIFKIVIVSLIFNSLLLLLCLLIKKETIDLNTYQMNLFRLENIPHTDFHKDNKSER